MRGGYVIRKGATCFQRKERTVPGGDGEGLGVREGGHVAGIDPQVGETNEITLIEGQRWGTEEAGDDTAHIWPQGRGLAGGEERPC